MISIQEATPRITARIAGVFYLATFVVGGVAQFAIGGLLVGNDARATAGNVLQHERLFWLGFAAYLLVLASYIAVTGLFYQLFKSVNGSLAMIAAFFSIVGCAIQGCACFFYLVPAFLGRQHSTMFTVEQLQVLAYLALKFYGQAYGICFVFFGFYCCFIGYLIFRSTFLPRTVGLMMILAGLAWLTFLVPPLADSHFPYVAGFGVAGEGSLTLWLLTKGVNVQKWKELSGRSSGLQSALGFQSKTSETPI